MRKDKVEETNQEKETKEKAAEVMDQPEETVQAEGQEVENGSSEAQAESVDDADKTEELEKELEESKDKYLRLYSEFENYRRRTSKEKVELIGSATRDLVVELIPVLDDFERALKSLEEKKESDSAREGVELIYNKFKRVLEGQGLKKMEVEKGSDFNEDFHEAITQVPAEKELEGKIVDIIEQGYFLNEKVARFAKVVTGSKT